MSNQNKIVGRPLTTQELRERAQNGVVTAVVALDLEEVMDASLDACNDLMSHSVTGSDTGLTDITWRIVGHTDVAVLLAVTGDVSDHLAELDDEENA